jgi:hypothetical protein
MVVSIIEENKNKILGINNFGEVKTYSNDNSIESSKNESNSFRLDDTIVENTNVESTINEIAEENTAENIENIENNVKVEENAEENIKNSEEDNKELINEDSLEIIHSEINNSINNPLLAGGVNDDIDYTIDFILADDEKLVDSEKIITQVNTYIDNFNNPNVQTYKKNFKQLYQTYSNKNYTISTIISNNNITKIIVTKNDKSKKIVKELTKPTYLYYDENNNLAKLKREISNARTELLYKYEKIIAKITITPDEKKEFEKERSNFIEQLELYYSYTLYHKKINKINNLNKTNITFQKEYLVFKENNEYESKILNSNIYQVENNDIATINKYNSDNLNDYNNIVLTLSSKKESELSKDKKLIEKIKSYIKNKNEINLFSNSLIKKTDLQDKIINFIIL